MKSKHILVTGGAGYIGSHVVKALSEQSQAEIIVLDNLSTGFADSVIGGELIIGDLLNAALLDTLFKQYTFDAVLHFAACTVIPESFADPLKYYRNNTLGTLNLLEACHRYHTKHFIFSSTAAVYAPLINKKITEEDPISPHHPYGRSKRMAEEMIFDLSRNSEMNYVILRYFNVAGAHPKGMLGQKTLYASHLIKAAVETACHKREHLPIFGTDYPTHDGTCIRDYIHVCDLADAHLRALEYLEDQGHSSILNCGYGTGSSVKQVIQAVETASGQSLPVLPCPRREGDLAYVIADPSRLMQVLHWKPQYNDLQWIVKTAYEFEKNHKSSTSKG